MGRSLPPDSAEIARLDTKTYSVIERHILAKAIHDLAHFRHDFNDIDGLPRRDCSWISDQLFCVRGQALTGARRIGRCDLRQ